MILCLDVLIRQQQNLICLCHEHVMHLNIMVLLNPLVNFENDNGVLWQWEKENIIILFEIIYHDFISSY